MLIHRTSVVAISLMRKSPDVGPFFLALLSNAVQCLATLNPTEPRQTEPENASHCRA